MSGEKSLYSFPLLYDPLDIKNKIFIGLIDKVLYQDFQEFKTLKLVSIRIKEKHIVLYKTSTMKSNSDYSVGINL